MFSINDTLKFFIILLKAPHRAYEKALIMLSDSQRLNYFRVSFAFIIFIVAAVVCFAFKSKGQSIETPFIIASVAFISFYIVGFYLYHACLAPFLLYKAGRWFNGTGTAEELNSFSLFSAFVLVCIDGVSQFISLEISFIGSLDFVLFKIFYFVYYIKGVQVLHHFDRFEAVLTVLLQYVISWAGLVLSLLLIYLGLWISIINTSTNDFLYIENKVRALNTTFYEFNALVGSSTLINRLAPLNFIRVKFDSEENKKQL